MNGRRVLVTGGAGFIGSNLVDRLLEAGAKVAVLDNLMSGYRKNLTDHPALEFMEGDIRDVATVSAVMAGKDTVFHLAASVGNARSISDPLVDADINVLGTIRVLEAARRAGVKRLVVSSSAGVFGELRTLPIREDHPIEPDSPYGCTKLCEEKMSLAFGRLYNLDVLCLRYFNVYGPRQRFDAYGNVIPIFVFRALRGEPLRVFGDGEQTRDFVHVDDVVQANMKAACSAGVSGAFNIASGTRVTVNRLAEIVRTVCGGSVQLERAQERPGDVRHSLADLSRAQLLLGYSPSTALEEGIGGYVQWARQELASAH